MYKKLILAVVSLIVIIALFSIPTFATGDGLGDGESSETSSDTSAESSSSEASSEEVSSSETSKFYIPDDSDYYTENLGSLGGTVTNSTIIYQSGTGSTNTSTASSPEAPARLDVKSIILKAIWIPLALIAACVLTLVLLKRIYTVKYKAIDPAAKQKAAKKASEKQNRKKKTHTPAKRKGNSGNHRPRD